MRNRQYRRIKWPVKGVDQGRSYTGQEPETCVYAVNVRNFDPRTGRLRGAQRAGLSRFMGNNTTANLRIQDIHQLVTHKTGVTASLSSLDNADYTYVVVSQGTVQTFTTAGATTVTGGAAALSTTSPVIFSADLFNKLYFADGASTKYYDAATNTLNTWTPTAGSLPGSGTTRPRLIEMWRARLVLSGLRTDPHNWFMSAVGDPLDWDYGADPATVTMAVAGNNAPAGKIGDVVNSMVPYDDDTMLFFGDHSIWQMTGDPAEGGRIDLVSDITGSSFGRPWTKGPLGEVYFYGSRGGIFRMTVGNKPERLSTARIEEQLWGVNLNTTIIRSFYDDRSQCVHFFVTPLTAAVSTHIVWDLRTESFWFDSYADKNYNPRAVCVLEGDAADDRVAVIGSDDGRIRYIDHASKNDDQKPVKSAVYLGPFTLEEARKIQLRELIVTLDENADGAYVDVIAGDSAMAAYELAEDAFGNSLGGSQTVFSAVIKPGRNYPERRRASGKAIYIKLASDDKDETWAFEDAYAYFVGSGLSRMRRP